MSDGDDAMLAMDDAATIGFKIVEMADRVTDMHRIMPGTKATWRFISDDVEYIVTVAIARDKRE